MINLSCCVGINFGRANIKRSFRHSVHFLILNNILKNVSSSRCRVSECYYYKYKQSSRTSEQAERHRGANNVSRLY